MTRTTYNRKAVLTGMLGNGLEWYDYALYGYMASVFAELFFPAGDAARNLVLTYLTFAAGFIARPVGAVIFGMIGDRYGRKRALSASMILMAVPTGCIALLPTYAQIGMAAPILLTLIRVLQGLSLGGAFSGAMSYIVEHAPEHRRASIGSLTISSLVLGFLVGSLAATLTANVFSEAEFMRIGWRIPFLIGMCIGPLGFYLSHKGEETPDYTPAAVGEGSDAASPLRILFGQHFNHLIGGFMVYLCVTVPFYLLAIYLLSFTQKHLGLGRSAALGINALAMTTLFVALWPFARMADRMGVYRSARLGAVLMLLVSWPAFQLIALGRMESVAVGQMLLAVALAAYAAPIPALLSRLFPTNVRCTGMAISYNCCAIIGGFVPSASEQLLTSTGSNTVVGYFPIAAAALSLHALGRLRKTGVL